MAYSRKYKNPSSNLSKHMHQNIQDSMLEEMGLDRQRVDRLFLQKLDNLMQRLQWQSQLQETTMLAKMKVAQLDDDSVMRADVAKAFISEIIAGQQGEKAFKELTMLTQWYQEELMRIQGKTAQTNIMLTDKKGTIQIASFESSIQNVDNPDELSSAFSKIFTLGKAASSKSKDGNGGFKARYRSSFKHLQGEKGFSLTTIKKDQRGELEDIYFEALRRANIMKQPFDAKSGKTKFQLGTGALIPVQTRKGVRYYNLSSMGDLNEAYLRLRAQKQSLVGASNEEKLLYLLNATHKVDNTSALLRGDFNVGKYEISAKSRGASAFGITQVIDHIYGLRSLVSGGKSRTKVYKSFDQFQYQTQNNSGKYETTLPEFEIPESTIQGIVDDLFKNAWTTT